jgi:hypothetical protein
MAEGTYTVMHLDLASLDSVRSSDTPGRAALGFGHLCACPRCCCCPAGFCHATGVTRH